jgi:hypothetical protein
MTNWDAAGQTMRALVMVALAANALTGQQATRVDSASQARGVLAGLVFDLRTKAPISGADVRLPATGRAVTADAVGRFELRAVPVGSQLLVVRAVGYLPESTTVDVREGETTQKEILLAPDPQRLPEVRVPGTASRGKLAGFEDRRRQGIGKFMDADMLAKQAGRTTGDILNALPGVSVWRGGTKAWIASTRAVTNDKCAFCKTDILELLDSMDIALGARPHCYMDVYVDGAMVYSYGRETIHPPPLFDINSIPPETIAGLEVYSSAAQIPAQYNRTSAGCGVIVVWLK